MLIVDLNIPGGVVTDLLYRMDSYMKVFGMNPKRLERHSSRTSADIDESNSSLYSGNWRKCCSKQPFDVLWCCIGHASWCRWGPSIYGQVDSSRNLIIYSNPLPVWIIGPMEFLKEMRSYMPPAHAGFISAVSKAPSVRKFGKHKCITCQENESKMN